MRTAVDSNAISAVWAGEASAVRVIELLDESERLGALVISPIVYVELRSFPGASERFVEQFLTSTRISVEWEITEQVWHAAAGRFQKYAERRRRHQHRAPRRLIADYLVGAHALLRADRLITLDQRVYRTDFPELTVVEL